MRRVIAFFLDHMLLSAIIAGPAFSLLDVSNPIIPTAFFPLVIFTGMVLWFGYFIIADYFFHGMTLGKKLLGLHMEWAEKKDAPLLGRVLLHMLLKWLLAVVWPIGLILYFVLGCKMPYDDRLGILYLYGKARTSEKVPVWKIILRTVAVIVVAIAFFYCFITFALHRISNIEYYTLKNEKISSVSTVLESPKLANYSSTGTGDAIEQHYKYSINSDGTELAERYIEYLVQNEDFHRSSELETVINSNVFVAQKETKDGQYTISISLSPYPDRLMVALYCIKNQ